MLFYLQSCVLFKALKLNLDFINFSRNWKNFQPIYELRKHTNWNFFFFMYLGEAIVLYIIAYFLKI